MIRVKNRRTIYRLALASLRSARMRNVMAALAICLTTLLFTSLFTIFFSANEAIQEANFRQVGTSAHGQFKSLSEEQYSNLRQDKRLKQQGLRRILGFADDPLLKRLQVEVSYMDATNAAWSYTTPKIGHLPKEGSQEAVFDETVLQLLGKPVQPGKTVSLHLDVDGHPLVADFVVSGIIAHSEDAKRVAHVLIPESRVTALIKEAGASATHPENGNTGLYDLNVKLSSPWHIAQKMQAILHDHGYQVGKKTEGNQVNIGVNWGYSASQWARQGDALVYGAVALTLLIIFLAGYLIIYNIFRISVVSDLRFYALLKTIGTTPRQLRQLLRLEALFLALIGMVPGLIAGWLVGAKLTPLVLSQMAVPQGIIALQPILFLAAALLTLITVFISVRRPGRLAARVAPVEALRAIDASHKCRRPLGKKALIPALAKAHLLQSPAKTMVTILSLALSLLLLNLSITLANSLDMDKYLRQVATDYIVADTQYFNLTRPGFSPETALPPNAVNDLRNQRGVSGFGITYGQTSVIKENISEADLRRTAIWPEDTLAHVEHLPSGLLSSECRCYGMTPEVLSHMKVVAGDISALSDPDQKNIAVVLRTDDYDVPEPDSHWLNVGDTVTLRFVSHQKIVNPDTGVPYPADVDLNTIDHWAWQADQFHEETYHVAALVTVPKTLSYRFYDLNQYILPAHAFTATTESAHIMYAAFDVPKAADRTHMNQYLKTLAKTSGQSIDSESRDTYRADFQDFRTKFLLLGLTLSVIVAFIGLLNLTATTLTNLITRRQMLATMEAVGTTRKQLKRLLILENILITAGAILLSLLLTLILTPFLSTATENVLWFLTWQPTFWPIALAAPLYLLITAVVPLLSLRRWQRTSLVDRLRPRER